MRRRRAGCVFDDARLSSLKRLPAKWPAIMASLVLAALCFWAGRSRVSDVFGTYRQFDSSSSPYATAADFTKYVMKLRNAAVLKAERPGVRVTFNLSIVRIHQTFIQPVHRTDRPDRSSDEVRGRVSESAMVVKATVRPALAWCPGKDQVTRPR